MCSMTAQATITRTLLILLMHCTLETWYPLARYAPLVPRHCCSYVTAFAVTHSGNCGESQSLTPAGKTEYHAVLLPLGVFHNYRTSAQH